MLLGMVDFLVRVKVSRMSETLGAMEATSAVTGWRYLAQTRLNDTTHWVTQTQLGKYEFLDLCLLHCDSLTVGTAQQGTRAKELPRTATICNREP